MTKYHGNLPWVFAAYNAGEGPVDKYQGKPPYPETIAYVRRGMARLRAVD
jgi:soluble lytic murein transglycosylase-like protein